ncbi:MAG: ABC transporter ATP-binding protein [Candidatus Rokuibacteriota bacterium]
MTPVIELESVAQAYRVYPRRRDRLLEALTLGYGAFHTAFWALRDVSLSVAPGTTLGVVGVNGSGKSTLLQVIAGIVEPTRGRAVVRGRVAALLELGAGFDPDFTGRENVELYGAIMGFSRPEARARLPAIAAFAEIGDFMDRPVKTYSSGMFVRLAFAAAIHVDPDILLVDEALAVGDAVFQHRCIRRIREFQDQGKTIVFVSHDLATVRAICSEVTLLDGGRVVATGDPVEVTNLYHAHVARLEGVPPPTTEGAAAALERGAWFAADPEFERRASLFRHGTGAARVRNVELLGPRGGRLSVVPFDAEVVLRVHVEYLDATPASVLGFFVRDKNGIDVLGTNTWEERRPLPARRAGETLVVDFRQRLPLQPGSYSVTLGVAYDPTQPAYLDWVDNAIVFEVLRPGNRQVHGKVGLPVEITIHG